MPVVVWRVQYRLGLSGRDEDNTSANYADKHGLMPTMIEK